MKVLYCFLLPIILIPFHSIAQNYEKVVYNSKDSTSYYLAVAPQSKEIKGVIMLLPGFGDIPENTFPETKIHNVAYLNQILVVSLGVGNKIFADEQVVKKINEVIKSVIDKYKVSNDTFIMGGFSAGGSIALRYTELAVENPNNYPAKIKAVFAVDSPIDIIDLFNYFEREIKKNFSEPGVNEARYIGDLMVKEYGSPKTNLNLYEKLTPFNKAKDGPGNEQFIKDIPVRVYHELDITWQLQNRRRSAYDSNFLNTSEMINRLLLMGSTKAEFIQSKLTGYRSNGMRHTHSWSIVDEVELIKWAKITLNIL